MPALSRPSKPSLRCDYKPQANWDHLQWHHPLWIRALCRTKLLPVTHVLVDTWTLTIKPVYTLKNVSDDLKWTTNTHVAPFTLTSKASLITSTVLEHLFVLLLHFFTVHPYLYPSTTVFTSPNDG